MRVIAPDPVVPAARLHPRADTTTIADAGSRAARTATIEALGLVAGTLVIVFGVWLTYSARAAVFEAIDRDLAAGRIVNLAALHDPQPLAPLLDMFADPAERDAVARVMYRRATARDITPLEHVGGLAALTLPAADVRRDRRLTALTAKLDARPTLLDVPILTPGELAKIKPRLIVRTPREFTDRAARSIALFLAAFWIAHLFRRSRARIGDPLLLPSAFLLCGLGMMTMIALRDPARDTLAVTAFTQGTLAGLVIFIAVSHLDLEASRLRRTVLAPLGTAVVLAIALLVFGAGPGTSGAKVNLFGVQPVEAIRLLVVFALAAYFARRWEFLREYSEAPTSARPWLRHARVPRWKDVRPVLVSMALVLAFFFLQKDLGPALVLACTFLLLYAIARGHVALSLTGLAMLVAGFAVAYWLDFPAVVRQRVAMWLDPWTNGVGGGDQIAHALWALATGATSGTGPGLGDPQLVPAAHTDLVLAAIGEELGFVGLAAIVGLYGVLCWRIFRVALGAPGDYTAFLSIGLGLALALQAFLIAGGLAGLLPLSGVVTPFLSFGRSSMLANFAALGVVASVAQRRGRVRAHLQRPLSIVGGLLAACALVVVWRIGWVQVVKADEIVTASTLTGQADGGYRYQYNPRLVAAARTIPRGTIFDRNGLPIATSRPADLEAHAKAFDAAHITVPPACASSDERCYPLGVIAFHLLGDWNHQTNWAARNTSFVERDADTELRGFDDRAQVVELRNPRTGAMESAIKRDYRDVLPLLRYRYRPNSAAVQAILGRVRDVRTSIDARLQARVAEALRQRIDAGGFTRGAALVLDADSGELLASASYPWPEASDLDASAVRSDDRTDRLLDRARYGLYPPGSTFKLVVAGAALRSTGASPNTTFACVRLPDGRVGNRIPGWSRPVRDDPLDTSPHGTVDLHRGLVVSCNAYFAQLALRLGPRALLDAASAFQIAAAQPPTVASLQQSLPQAGYGQGEVVASPLKMARVAAAIAAGGAIVPVTWMKADAKSPGHPERWLTPADAATLARYMREVVTSGTGRVLAANKTPIAGKTGTAEVRDGASHSWFAGFAPYEGAGHRRIAFAVIVEHAGYGARGAAPVAGDIVDAARALGVVR